MFVAIFSCVCSSRVTTAPATQGGGILPNLLFFKRKIVRLGSKMDHISANLAFGRREKICGYRKLENNYKLFSKTLDF